MKPPKKVDMPPHSAAFQPHLAIRLKLLHPQMGGSIPLPQRMTPQAAGFDLAAALDAPLPLAPGTWARVPLGFAMALPPGSEAQIRPRSGLAARHGITCLNAPGTIDADYRGEVAVLLINHGPKVFTLEPGMRVAQMVVVWLPPVSLEQVAHLDDSQRGDRGFGSTG